MLRCVLSCSVWFVLRCLSYRVLCIVSCGLERCILYCVLCSAITRVYLLVDGDLGRHLELYIYIYVYRLCVCHVFLCMHTSGIVCAPAAPSATARRSQKPKLFNLRRSYETLVQTSLAKTQDPTWAKCMDIPAMDLISAFEMPANISSGQYLRSSWGRSAKQW